MSIAFNPDKWVGSPSVIVTFRTSAGEIQGVQGAFAHGPAVGLATRYAYCSIWPQGRPAWSTIPDDATIVAVLPYRAEGTRVEITEGEHSGATGVVVSQITLGGTVDVKIGQEVIRFPAHAVVANVPAK